MADLKKSLKASLLASIFLAGLSSVAAQVILLREFIAIFYGNELIMSMLLGFWLVCVALGSWIAGRLAQREKPALHFLAFLELSLGILLFCSIIAARWIRPLLGVFAGQVISLPAILSSSLLIIAPLCLLFGSIYSFSCSAISSLKDAAETGNPGRVYLLEAAGSVAGGFLCSFILIRYFNSLAIMAMLGTLNLAAASALAFFLGKRSRAAVATVALTVLGLMFVSFPCAVWEKLDLFTLKWQWPGYELLASKNTIYGNISIVAKNGELSLFENAILSYSSGDRQRAEEAGHLPLLEHPSPSRVLLLGGWPQLLEEVFKEPVGQVDYVEADPQVINLSRDYFNREFARLSADKRLNIINMDARAYVKRSAETYDVIIINLGDPRNIQLNRYYTVEFFKELKKLLRRGGVVSFGLSGSEDYIGKELGRFLQSIYLSLKQAFEQVIAIPGNTIYFLASCGQPAFTYDYNLLTERQQQRGLELQYLRPYYLCSRLDNSRINYLQELLRGKRLAMANRDFQPVSCYYNMIFWSTHFNGSLLTAILRSADEKTFWLLLLFACFFIALRLSAAAKRGKLPEAAAASSLVLFGFSGMALQVIILISFQSAYGYLFYKLGIIIAAFMAGLLLAGCQAAKLSSRPQDTRRAFRRICLAMPAYVLILPWVLSFFCANRALFLGWLGANIAFALLAFFAGSLVGAQFILANSIYIGACADGPASTGKAGCAYALDLCGAFFGALLSGVFLIPVLGIAKTCLGIAVLLLIPNLFIDRSYLRK